MATRLICCGALLVMTIAAIPPLLAAIEALTIVLGIQDDISSVSLDDGQGVVTLRRRPIWHPVLTNEYYRYLIVTQADSPPWRVDLMEDTGGGASLQLLAATSTVFLLADRFACYRLDLGDRSLREVSTIRGEEHRLIGVFDEDPQTGKGRFIRAEGMESLSNAMRPDCGNSL